MVNMSVELVYRPAPCTELLAEIDWIEMRWKQQKGEATDFRTGHVHNWSHCLNSPIIEALAYAHLQEKSLNKMAATHLYRSAATCSFGDEGRKRRENDTSFRSYAKKKRGNDKTGTQMTDLGNWKWFRKIRVGKQSTKPRPTSPRKRSKLWS